MSFDLFFFVFLYVRMDTKLQMLFRRILKIFIQCDFRSFSCFEIFEKKINVCTSLQFLHIVYLLMLKFHFTLSYFLHFVFQNNKTQFSSSSLWIFYLEFFFAGILISSKSKCQLDFKLPVAASSIKLLVVVNSSHSSMLKISYMDNSFTGSKTKRIKGFQNTEDICSNNL